MDENVQENIEALRISKTPYPKGMVFILGTELCERFTFYGIRGILALYLNRIHFYTRKGSTIIYHSFTGFGYLTCLVGAIVADGYTGKYWAIILSKIFYLIGCFSVVFGTIDHLNFPPQIATIFGLMLVALGSGAMKPCISAFSGDQFILPEQEKHMSIFFSIFYFTVNAGALLAMFGTPVLYSEVHCFGKTTCFALAFGLPSVVLILALIIFLIGGPFYNKEPPTGSKCILVGFVIANALVTQCKQRKTNPQKHFLDYAQPKYGDQLVEDIKVMLRQVILYFPAPVFWALFEQKGSKWVFQATKMDMKLYNVSIKPEHMQLVNPLLILLFIPLFQYAIYPLLQTIGIKRPLQKLTIGGFLAGCSFVVAGIVELYVEPAFNEHIPPGTSHLRVFNGLSCCTYSVHSNIPNATSFNIPPLSYYENLRVDVQKFRKIRLQFHSANRGCSNFTKFLGLEQRTTENFFIHGSESNPSFEKFTLREMPVQDGKYFVHSLFSKNISNAYMIQEGSKKRIDLLSNRFLELDTATYHIFINGRKACLHHATHGEFVALMVGSGMGNLLTKISIMPRNRLHVFWQFPQYILMSMGEVMFSITGLEFSYSQAPLSMKSVLQACWFLTVAVGNLLVVIIARTNQLRSIAHDFFLYAGLMFLSMILFVFLAYHYIPNNPINTSNIQIDDVQ